MRESYKVQQKLRVKRRVSINSLEAAICNVALFKGMKDKDFRDSIFISYCEQGVILQAINEQEWRRAHNYIENFLHNKKIQLLIDGYDKDVYENLISKGLKDVTRKVRQKDEQCPYINIIHYQKLRKSCEYMDKERYVDPLKQWEKKNKKNPNFAFLIVEPKNKFDEVKRSLLQYLFNEPVPLQHQTLDPIYFMYLLFYSPVKEKVKNHYNRRQIEISIEKEEESRMIKFTNFTQLNLEQYCYTVIRGESSIAKSGVGLQVISEKELKQEIKNAKYYCKDNPNDVIQAAIAELQQQFGENFVIIPYRLEEEQKYKTLIEKFTLTKLSKEDIERKLQSHQICQFQDIEFMGQIKAGQKFKAWKAYINNCPFLVHEYAGSQIDMGTFLIYLDQLQLYYCTFLIRYYGIAVKEIRPTANSYQDNQIFFLIFDYHSTTLASMKENEMILDNMQIANIILQIYYMVNMLHSHEQPRCFGPILLDSIYWPLATTLPFLGQNGQNAAYSIENDIRQIGLLMQQFLGNSEDEDLSSLIRQTTQENKYQRPSIRKCITQLEELLCL